jgi:iron complex transport system permease protein
MARIPRSVALLLFLAAAAAATAGSLLVGSVPVRDLTWEILRDYRIPHAMLALLVGASLGASGVCFQALFRNALADPFVVGVSGGAALGAVASIVLGLRTTLLGLGGTTAAAFAGGLGAAFLAYRLARVRGRVPVESLLLAGFAIGSFSGALVSFLVLAGRHDWNEVIGWLMGNLGQPDPMYRAAVVSPCLGLSAAIMAFHARDLNLLLLGEESAAQLGIEAEKIKGRLLAAGSIAAAGAVATCGMIGFVGLIVPHVARRLVGPDHRTLLPVAVVAGGALLALADAAARALSPGSPLPIGAVTAVAGAPFFIYVMRLKKGG